MYKMDITCEDFNGNEIKSTEYFNLNKVQAMKLVASHGGMDKYLQSIIDKKEAGAADFIEFVEELVYKAYGKRNEDGSFDIKEETKEEFTKTPQYDETVYTLLTNVDEFQKFFTGILPKAMQDLVREGEKADKA